MKLFIFAFFSVLVLSLFTLFPSFHLALFGDDWLVFYRYLKDLGPQSSGPYNNFTFLFTPYGSFDVLMGFLRNFYGYNSTPYYITSYVFRLIASFSFYPIIYYLTKNKYAAIFAIIFFSIAPVGLDTTNWVFNMPSYITIAFFNLFLYFFFLSREPGKGKLLFLSGLFYYLAYVITPIRMHGSLPFVILIEFFWLSRNFNLKNSKNIALRLSLIMFIFLFIRFSGHSMGPPEESWYRLSLGLTTSLDLLKEDRFDFIFYPLVIFGSLLVPDNLVHTRQIISARDLVLNFLLSIFIGYLIISSLLQKSINLFAKYPWIIISMFGLFWTFSVILIYKSNIITFSSSRYLILLSITGYLLFILVSLIYKYIKNNNIADGLFLGLTWSIMSFFFAWWWTPTSIFETTHRYLVVSAIGITTILSVVLSIILKSKTSLPAYLFILIVLLHIFSTRTYLNHLVEIRGQEVTEKIWSQITSNIKIQNYKIPSVLYFEGDETNQETLHDVITYGFSSHMALIYNLEFTYFPPLPLDDYRELSIVFSDGKNLPKYGYPLNPIPIDNIYAFRLDGRDHLIDITSQIREKLRMTKI